MTVPFEDAMDPVKLEKFVTNSEVSKKALEGKTIKKVVSIKGKIVNFVIDVPESTLEK